MKDVVIVSAARTAIGKYGGNLAPLRAPDLTVPVMQEIIARAGISMELVDDVIWGCCFQRTKGEQDLARVAAIKAGFPVEVPGVTINRTCTSAMQAIIFGTQAIKSGDAEVIMAGGTESMSNVPYTLDQMRWGAKMDHVECRDALWDGLTTLGIGPAMGITAENLAEKYAITREEQDELAYQSNIKAVNAIRNRRFIEEIVAVNVKGTVITEDEQPRADTSIEKLSKLKPIFKENGTVTAGNSSSINDGSAGVLLMSREKANSLGVKALCQISSYAVAGVPPEIMGIGPVPSTKKALQKAGLSLQQIQLLEINEAFASQYLAVEKELELNREIVNVNGSGIGLGHPVGASGARIVVSLLYEMIKRDLQVGLASLCSGGGMGVSLIIER